jgi:hypothetical protein
LVGEQVRACLILKQPPPIVRGEPLTSRGSRRPAQQRGSLLPGELLDRAFCRPPRPRDRLYRVTERQRFEQVVSDLGSAPPLSFRPWNSSGA